MTYLTQLLDRSRINILFVRFPNRCLALGDVCHVQSSLKLKLYFVRDVSNNQSLEATEEILAGIYMDAGAIHDAPGIFYDTIGAIVNGAPPTHTKLPYEILAMIFSQCQNSEIKNPAAINTTSLWNLTSVCFQCKAVAGSIPELWTNIKGYSRSEFRKVCCQIRLRSPGPPPPLPPPS